MPQRAEGGCTGRAFAASLEVRKALVGARRGDRKQRDRRQGDHRRLRGMEPMRTTRAADRSEPGAALVAHVGGVPSCVRASLGSTSTVTASAAEANLPSFRGLEAVPLAWRFETQGLNTLRTMQKDPC